MLHHSGKNRSHSRTKTCGQTQGRLPETNLLVFFGHPLVPVVEHIQPFSFSLPEHVWRNIITAVSENKERLDHFSDVIMSTPTHRDRHTIMHVSKYRVGNQEPVLVQNRLPYHSIPLMV